MTEYTYKYCNKTYVGKAYNSHFQVCQSYKDAKKNWNKLCKCGCKNITSFDKEYLPGHNMKIRDIERDKKISISLKIGYSSGRIKSRGGAPTGIITPGFTGHTHTKESKDKQRKSLEITLSREGYIHPNKGKILTKEIKEKIRDSVLDYWDFHTRIGNQIFWNEGQTKEDNIKLKELGEKISGVILSNPKEVERRSEWMKNYNLNKKDYSKVWNIGMKPWEWMKISEIKFFEMLSEVQHRRPNNFEYKFIEIIRKNNLPFNYVGNGELWINGKNPDFVHNNEKILIELLGDFWHTKEEVNERIEHFKKSGFRTVTIWEHEIKKLDDNKISEILINKIDLI